MKSSTYVWIVLAILAGIAVGYSISQMVGAPSAISNTNSSTNIVTTTNTANTPSPATVKIYAVALNDAGKLGEKFGCDDSLVPVTVTADNTLASALATLFVYDPATAGQDSLTNFIRTLDLKVDQITTVGTELRVALSGTISFGGVCDTPRLTEPLLATIEPYLEGKTAVVTINGKTLQEITSLQ